VAAAAFGVYLGFMRRNSVLCTAIGANVYHIGSHIFIQVPIACGQLSFIFTGLIPLPGRLNNNNSNCAVNRLKNLYSKPESDTNRKNTIAVKKS
jgi:hypothetical protein